MHKQASGKDGEVVYKTVNVYSQEKRPLFFISDVPHLIKTVRNCWSNSFAHTQTRTLKVGSHAMNDKMCAHVHCTECIHSSF